MTEKARFIIILAATVLLYISVFMLLPADAADRYIETMDLITARDGTGCSPDWPKHIYELWKTKRISLIDKCIPRMHNGSVTCFGSIEGGKDPCYGDYGYSIFKVTEEVLDEELKLGKSVFFITKENMNALLFSWYPSGQIIYKLDAKNKSHYRTEITGNAKHIN